MNGASIDIPARARAALGALGAAAAALLLAACGSDEGAPTVPDAQSQLESPAATEASPEAEAAEPAGDPGQLEPDERERVKAAVRAYVAALDARDGAAVCAAVAPGAIRAGDFPGEVAATVHRELPGPASPAAACAGLVELTIGRGGAGGTPAWKRTTIDELKAVSVGQDAARVTATVTHDFSDRSYVSLEEDVIYLRRGPGGEWLLAKPSGSFYRAVGFPEPPLRALKPP